MVTTSAASSIVISFSPSPSAAVQPSMLGLERLKLGEKAVVLGVLAVAGFGATMRQAIATSFSFAGLLALVVSCSTPSRTTTPK